MGGRAQRVRILSSKASITQSKCQLLLAIKEGLCTYCAREKIAIRKVSQSYAQFLEKNSLQVQDFHLAAECVQYKVPSAKNLLTYIV